MEALCAVIICILSALGLTTLAWSLVGMFLLPVKSSDECRIHIILDTRGTGNGLQYMMNSLDWIKDAGLMEFDTVILNSGMDEETLRISDILAQKEGVSLCAPETLYETLTEK